MEKLIPLFVIVFIIIFYSFSHFKETFEEIKNYMEKKENFNNIREKFTSVDETFARSAELLPHGWRHRKLPQPLEPYYGPIQGYNCGEYSEFSFNNVSSPCLRFGECDTEYVIPSNNPNGYIFPNKEAYKTEKPLAPFSLNHEKDVVNARIDYAEDSSKTADDFAKKLSAIEADYLDRPNIHYNRGDGSWVPILTEENRYRQKYAY